MKPLLKLAAACLLGLIFCAVAHCQGGPDCQIGPQTFTAAGSGQNFDNRYLGCTKWDFVYNCTGFTVVSVEIDEAPDSSGAPGTFVTYPNLCSGSLPITTTTSGQITAYGYFPWIATKANTLTGTGSCTMKAFGWRSAPGTDVNAACPNTVTTIPSASSTTKANITQVGGAAVALGQAAMASSIPVTIASNQSNLPANITQVGGAAVALGQVAMASSIPVTIASNQSNLPDNLVQVGGTNVSTGTDPGGAGVPRVTVSNDSSLAANQSVNVTQINGNASDLDPCASPGILPSSAFANISTATTTALVAVSGATTVYVCGIEMTSTSTVTANTIIFEQGTGVACASSPVSLTATFNNGITGADIIQWGNAGRTIFKTAASNGLCAVSTVGTTPAIGITVAYVQK